MGKIDQRLIEKCKNYSQDLNINNLSTGRNHQNFKLFHDNISCIRISEYVYNVLNHLRNGKGIITH